MNLKFYKLHCAMSDVILLDFLKEGQGKPPNLDAVARTVCRRKSGIGASLLVVLEGSRSDIWLRAFLPSGEETEVVNDAAACASRYVLDSGLVASGFSFRTKKGSLRAEAVDSESVRIPLGRPERPEGGEAGEAEIANKRLVLETGDSRLSLIPLKVGYPYAVFYFESSKKTSLKKASSPILRDRGLIPLAVRVISREEFRVFGQSRAISDSCSAAGAALAASVSAGFCERTAAAVLPSGTVYVSWREGSGELFATASAEYVFEGEFWYEDHAAETAFENRIK